MILRFCFFSIQTKLWLKLLWFCFFKNDLTCTFIFTKTNQHQAGIIKIYVRGDFVVSVKEM